jgi:hypothetical protein
MLATVSRAPLLIRLVAPLAAVVRTEVHSRVVVDPTLPAIRIVADFDKARRTPTGRPSSRSISRGTAGFNWLNPLAATVFRPRDCRAAWMEA